jgi:hypothetical protein
VKRYTPNKFLARPEGHAGPTMAGVHSHPGFHTTGTIEVAACYAQAHVVTSMGYELGEALDDYPAIVTLDMDGLTPLADYDAEKTLWPNIIYVLRGFFRMNPDANENNLQAWLEVDVSEGREPLGRGDSATDALFTIAGWRIESPYAALSSTIWQMPRPREGVMEFLRRLASEEEKPSADLLCALSDQYRYADDVSESRVLAVDSMRPYWPELLDYQEDESGSDRAEKIEAAGWSVLDVDDVYSEQARVVTTRVYSKRSRPKRPEYHGTSYRNLLSAAPRLGKKLPVPPPPFRGTK